MLIATAGHVDHGKTALLRALTGIDTDRLAEEKRRGLSIDLGFAYQSLDDGSDRRIGFIDVPGHQRFARNMLAGVAAIDMVLLVVAADDGVMPQTREHLTVIELLGVDRAAVALTKIDRVPAARTAEVAAEVAALLAPTRLAGAAQFPLSALTGAGVTALAEHLRAAAAALPARSEAGRFRLAVDRCFSLPGPGTVVTGAVFAGAVTAGDRLRLLPDGRLLRVRAVHAQGVATGRAVAGQRCALNVVGQGRSVKADDLRRGDWLTDPQAVPLTERADAWLHPAGDGAPLNHRTPLQIHFGAGVVPGRMVPLQRPTGLAQLVLQRPVLLLAGDRVILRDPSSQHCVAGATVIDPYPPRRGRANPARVELLQALAKRNTPEQALPVLLSLAPLGLEPDTFAAAYNLTSAQVGALLGSVPAARLAGVEGRTVALAEPRWRALRGAVLTALERWHADYPEQLGPDAATLRQTCAIAEAAALFNAALRRLVDAGAVAATGARYHLPGHRPSLSDEDQQWLQRLAEHVGPERLQPPALKDLARLLTAEPEPLEKFLRRAARAGLLVRVSPHRYFHPQAVDRLRKLCRQLGAAEGGRLELRRFRAASRIGRNTAIEVLEYFDAAGLTRRSGDHRLVLGGHGEA